MIYEYKCQRCNHKFERILRMADRYDPVNEECPECGIAEVIIKVPTAITFTVPEGALGNASTGYAEYHGDAENFKAAAKGQPKPYPKPKKGQG